MFDASVPGIADLQALSDAALIDTARGWARAENTACATKLAVMAEIFIRRTGLPAGDRESWWVDPTAAVSAELAAAQNITRSLALHQTHRGVVLRDRLPAVGALFAQGLISEMLVRTIVSRTDLILQDTAMAAMDTDLAAQIRTWGPRSAKKIELAIDALVELHDPGALRRARESDTTPDVVFGSPTDTPGFTTLWARLYDTDAVIIEQCLRDTTYTLCEADPRGRGERLAAAITARITGTPLTCTCAGQDCDARPQPDRPTKDMTVYVITDTTGPTAEPATPPSSPDDPNDTPTGGSDSVVGGDEPTDEDAAADEDPDVEDADVEDAGDESADAHTGEDADQGVADADAPTGEGADSAQQTPTPATRDTLADICGSAKPGFVFGAGIVPNQLLDRLLTGARFIEIRHPGNAGPEPRYTPSRALADFIRCRDLTCRFPHCDHPATAADIDHTVPYPVGPTHASNLKILCRFHHLLKTFWIGALGWRDRQYPDGSIIWTSPTGHTYTTYPGSRLLFPALCHPTATLWTGDPPTVDLSDRRGEAMPRRRRTRAQNRARVITVERRLNDDLVAEHNTPPPF